jgi:hypothetical protein
VQWKLVLGFKNFAVIKINIVNLMSIPVDGNNKELK